MASNSKTSYHIESLKRENYDTWKLHAQAILIRNNLWAYVSGTKTEPEKADEKEKWKIEDLQARSELILLISPSELKQVKNCGTSKEVWDTLSNIYQSKGPARKATLLKQLVIHKMREKDDVRDHLNKFTDTVDKLSDMGVDINEELLSIMMLYSLSSSYENFRIAIESRDTVPKPHDLKIKIIEESEARNKNNITQEEGAFYFKGNKKLFHNKPNKKGLQCYKCKKFGHTIKTVDIIKEINTSQT